MSASIRQRRAGAAGPIVRAFRKGWAAPVGMVRVHFMRREALSFATASCGRFSIMAGRLHEPGVRPQCKVCRRVLYGKAA